MPHRTVVDLVGAHSRPVLAEPQRGSPVLRGGEDQVPISVVDHTRNRALVALEEDGAHGCFALRRRARLLGVSSDEAQRRQRAGNLAEL